MPKSTLERTLKNMHRLLLKFLKQIFSFPKKFFFFSYFIFSLIILQNIFAQEPKLNQTAVIIPGSNIQAYKYQFSNGLKLIVVPDKRNPISTMHFILDAGSNRETKGTTGLAHFFEHMMFRKTMGTPEGNYDKVLNSVGGSGNAGTNDSFVTFYSSFPGPALETMIKLEAARFQNLDITDPFYSIEKGAVISERKLRVENDPLTRSNELLRAIVERDTPMEWMTIGSKADVENMSIDAAKQFYKNFYTPDNTLMIIGGPFDPKNVVTLVQKYFGSWKGKLNIPHAKLPNDYFTRDLGKRFICSAPIFTKKYRVIYPSNNTNIKSIVYSLLFQSLLDDNKEGTFERRLIKSKLATDFGFYKVYWQNQNNPLIASLSLSKDQKLEPVLNFWEKAIQEVLNKPISEKIRRQILKQLAVSNAETAEKMTSLVSTVLDNTFFLNDFNAAGQAENIIKTVTNESFKHWVKENLSSNKFYITGVVTPDEAPSCTNFYSEFLKNKETKNVPSK